MAFALSSLAWCHPSTDTHTPCRTCTLRSSLTTETGRTGISLGYSPEELRNCFQPKHLGRHERNDLALLEIVRLGEDTDNWLSRLITLKAIYTGTSDMHMVRKFAKEMASLRYLAVIFQRNSGLQEVEAVSTILTSGRTAACLKRLELWAYWPGVRRAHSSTISSIRLVSVENSTHSTSLFGVRREETNRQS